MPQISMSSLAEAWFLPSMNCLKPNSLGVKASKSSSFSCKPSSASPASCPVGVYSRLVPRCQQMRKKQKNEAFPKMATISHIKYNNASGKIKVSSHDAK